ncbi:MAG: 2-oxo-4-hydroxy-4-carboxy-5-ureidoimidazoline decarboxylase [Candidatus Tokpelaia sp. JSC085]|nr:MAG: 2-oxo-4-hydroxy-4-carboxy-5-ureidoimidazoline decarboxylase [Candidatus Tokpelaia sp. JSC085]
MKTDVVDLATLNAASSEVFCSILSGIFENSSWVVRSIVSRRPFATIQELYQSMLTEVMQAGEEKQIALICAHPDLAGTATRQGTLTDESRDEQEGIGLDRLDAKEFAEFHQLNMAYKERFGFPCIIAIRGFDKPHDKCSILTTMRERLHNSQSDECQEALRQIARIAELRLKDLTGQ